MFRIRNQSIDLIHSKPVIRQFNWVLPIYLFLLMIPLFFSAHVSANPTNTKVGEIVFALGQAYVQHEGGEQQAVRRGMTILGKSRIITKARAQVGLRMIDGANTQIRENSEFLIDIYDYNAEQPEKSKVKMELIEGEARSRTGKAGEAAKHNYRLNTPVAAIGIRGTDFTVQTSATWTKVVVHSGAIVMSGFDSLCSQAGLGSCSGRGTMALLAEQREQALLLHKGEQRPELIPATEIPTTQQPIEVPKTLPDTSATESENNAPTTASTQTAAPANTSNTVNTVANVATTASSATSNSAARPAPSTQALGRAAPTTQTGSVDQSANEDNVSTSLDSDASSSSLGAEPVVKWGRWDPELIETQLAEGYELVVQQGDYAIIRREDEEITLPNEGVYHFKPTRSEAFVRHIPTETYQKAAVNEANLTVDFIDRQFDTQFTLNNDDLNTVVAAQGQLSDDGILRSDGSHENTHITGALANGGDAASYAFTHQVDENTSAAGAIDWGTPEIEQVLLQP
jgi:hypothetical protein